MGYFVIYIDKKNPWLLFLYVYNGFYSLVYTWLIYFLWNLYRLYHKRSPHDSRGRGEVMPTLFFQNKWGKLFIAHFKQFFEVFVLLIHIYVYVYSGSQLSNEAYLKLNSEYPGKRKPVKNFQLRNKTSIYILFDLISISQFVVNLCRLFIFLS